MLGQTEQGAKEGDAAGEAGEHGGAGGGGCEAEEVVGEDQPRPEEGLSRKQESKRFKMGREDFQKGGGESKIEI